MWPFRKSIKHDVATDVNLLGPEPLIFDLVTDDIARQMAEEVKQRNPDDQYIVIEVSEDDRSKISSYRALYQAFTKRAQELGYSANCHNPWEFLLTKA